MTAVTWQQLLANAMTSDEVIGIARDFVANVDRVQLSMLPSQCQPGKMFVALDVHSYAYELARHHCAADDETRETVEQLSAFFSHAAIRLSQLEASNESNAEVRVRLFM